MAIEKLKNIKQSDNGLVIFSGIVNENNGSSKTEICEIIIPPLPVVKNLYLCDSKFHTEYIIDLFDDHIKYGFVIISNEDALIATLKGTQRIIVKKIAGCLITETRRGGQSANRIARIRTERRELYKNQIVDSCLLFRNINSIIVAGNGDFPIDVMNSIKEDTRINSKILGFIKTSHSDLHVALNEAIKKADNLMVENVSNEESKYITKIQELIMNCPDKLVFGKQHIIDLDYDNLIEYILVNKNISNDVKTNCLKYDIVHSRYLDDFDGVIGVMYF